MNPSTFYPSANVDKKRLLECLRLRDKDVDFDLHQTVVRDGKGGKDRVPLLPANTTEALREKIVT